MRRLGWVRLAVAAGMVGGLVAPLRAQQLDPRVAGPLTQMLNGAGAQCQAGNMQACGMAQQLQQMGNQLVQAQFACQQGNPQACQYFQMGSQQVLAAYQQQLGAVPGGGMPQAQGYSPQQQAFDHQQRMQQQQMMFQQHQTQMQQQQQQMNDLQHQRFLEQLRR